MIRPQSRSQSPSHQRRGSDGDLLIPRRPSQGDNRGHFDDQDVPTVVTTPSQQHQQQHHHHQQHPQYNHYIEILLQQLRDHHEIGEEYAQEINLVRSYDAAVMELSRRGCDHQQNTQLFSLYEENEKHLLKPLDYTYIPTKFLLSIVQHVNQHSQRIIEHLARESINSLPFFKMTPQQYLQASHYYPHLYGFLYNSRGIISLIDPTREITHGSMMKKIHRLFQFDIWESHFLTVRGHLPDAHQKNEFLQLIDHFQPPQPYYEFYLRIYALLKNDLHKSLLAKQHHCFLSYY